MHFFFLFHLFIYFISKFFKINFWYGGSLGRGRGKNMAEIVLDFSCEILT